jgi:hypothetical protein
MKTRTQPMDPGTEILARLLPARELAEALAAEPLDTVEDLLDDLKSLGDEELMPDFSLGAWARHVVEFQDQIRIERLKEATMAAKQVKQQRPSAGGPKPTWGREARCR